MLAETETARFHTRSGLLTCTCSNGWINMNFPATPEQTIILPEGIAEALGVEISYAGASKFDYLIEITSMETLRKLQPDFPRLKALTRRGVMVTCRSDTQEYDFVSRFFAPAVGINEDPVTGSAHCCLAPYWGPKLGKSAMTAFQASARGGVVRVLLSGERVIISGQAVTIFRGDLL